MLEKMIAFFRSEFFRAMAQGMNSAFLNQFQ